MTNRWRTAWRITGLGLLAGSILGGAVAATRLVVSIGETRQAAPDHHQVLGRPGWGASRELVAQQPALLSYIPTYHRDVAPILAASCSGCHVSGGIAPFELTSPASATKHAAEILAAVRTRHMPPWMPGSDSPRFEHETRLTDTQIAVLANWVWAGAPLGKATDAKVATARPAAPAPDRTVDIGRDFTPDARLSDEYRCFVIEAGLGAERFLSGYDIAPGNRAIVHHVLIFQATGDYLAQARNLEKADDGRGGYTCFGGVGVGTTSLARVGSPSSPSASGSGTVGFVGSWVPGSTTVTFPAGAGLLLKPGAGLIMQVHYNLNAGPSAARTPDRTAAKLYFAPEGAKLKPLRLLTLVAPVEVPCSGPYPADPKNLCNRDAAYDRVAAYQSSTLTAALRSGLLLDYCKTGRGESSKGGPADAVVTRCDFPVNSNRLALGVQGHMHLLGTAISLELNPGTSKARTLLRIPRWDFHWQSGYWFAEPIELTKGDTVRITCTYDNTPEAQAWVGGKQAAPRYIVWGEGTTDEMCLGAVQTVDR